ncbi:Phosphotransferase system IIB component [Spiroplasma gladiatoris]|uniref:Phosphotransferase system IIB component n=1 Tax=Spiroplasma gladiatoris TaxID=2143 RepID=A0A4P7AJD5_9MOLU|nr:PTS transporter subunit EIIC [Spiroplasma gladiatoris]QBQ07776.1 Phosphotransferase system IIB component [Spiroplasma gladiatoris]
MSEAKIKLSKGEKLLEKKQKTSSGKGNSWNTFLNKLQELGKALQFPIAILPFAAILNRFGALGMSLTSVVENGETVITNYIGYYISLIFQKPGGVPFDNLPLFFALGTAFGLAKDHRGEVTLVSAVLYLSLTALTSEGTIPQMLYGKVFTFEDIKSNVFSKLLYVPKIAKDTTDVIEGGEYVLNIGVLGGIVAGCLSAWLYNRLSEIKLPIALSFFGGRRFVPMVALASSIPLALIFAIIWPWIQFGLISFGKVITPDNPAVAIPGTMVYGLLNRLLLPFGLHQVLNTFFWFQMPISGDKIAPLTGAVLGNSQIVNGDINAFTAGISNSGLFQSGFFPIMMGGLPLAAVAMIFATKKEKRKEVAGFLGGVAGVSFLSGITEPLEFSFVFISPLLLGIHSVLTSIFVGISTAMKIQIGFGFSAGFIDYAISFAQSWGLAKHSGESSGVWSIISNPLMVLVLTVAAGVIYYFTFYFVIVKMNVLTPGREAVDENAVANSSSTAKSKPAKGSEKYINMAAEILEAIGKDNLVLIDNCATRLRLQVKDNSLIDQKRVKAAGAFGTKLLGAESVQIVIGPDVEHVARELQKIAK